MFPFKFHLNSLLVWSSWFIGESFYQRFVWKWKTWEKVSSVGRLGQ